MQGNTELALVWAVGQKMWQRDFPGVYEALKKDWNNGLRPIMDAVLGMFVVVLESSSAVLAYLYHI
jgi:hypothetical protein